MLQYIIGMDDKKKSGNYHIITGSMCNRLNGFFSDSGQSKVLAILLPHTVIVCF